MLGCHDFCGYYEWTFHYIRRRFGEEALARYWREAIAHDSQQHYIEAAREQGLPGLKACWDATGESEQCDWTVALDEQQETLRLDMHGCPSKGYLLDHDQNADEDYCDHCIGWIGPALHGVGLEVVAHEHNHRGQCWWQISRRGAAEKPDLLPSDIRLLEEWQRGYLHRFERHQPVLTGEPNNAIDSVAALEQAFSGSERVAIVGGQFDAAADGPRLDAEGCIVCVASAYGMLVDRGTLPRVVVATSNDAEWEALGVAWNRVARDQWPLLVHDYLPSNATPAWSAVSLPRPLPLLPTLIRAGRYRHKPGAAPQSANQWACLLVEALGKQMVPIGIAESYDS